VKRFIYPLRAAAVAVGLAAAVSSVAWSLEAQSPDFPDNSIGYESVAAALDALRSKPGAQAVEYNGWVIIRDDETESATAVWLFVPRDHPAYPAVVKRLISERDGKAYLQTRSLCAGDALACGALEFESRDINNKLLAESQARSGWVPKQPLATGRYEFQHRFAEHPDMKSIKLVGEIIDDHIVLTNADSEEVFPFGVIDQGTLMWHAASQQWIIGTSDDDRTAEHVGGCSDGPSVIDLVKREYWTC
jgi:hypothetical protein